MCGDGYADFTERCRTSLTAAKAIVQIPAWVCDTCRYVAPVRRAHQRGAAGTSGESGR
jgi:hypothetical protein